MKNLMIVPVLVLGLAGGLVGCATPQEPASPRADHIPFEQYPKITASPELAPFLVIANPSVVEEGVLKVTTPVRLTSRPGRWSKVQYRYIFLDGRGNPLKVQPEWMPVTMEPNQQVFMTGNAMDNNAADWRLEIRPQR